MKLRPLALLSLFLFPLAAQVVTINGTDVVANSRTTINNNFAWVNTHILGAAGSPNTAAEQAFITSGLAAGAWLTIPNCPDGGGVHLNYDTSNPSRWVCGTSGIWSLNGLSGASQTFANDTNVTIVSAGTVHTITWAGLLGLARGGCNANLVSTGGAHQVLRQSSSGAACTVSQLASADLSDVANLVNTGANFTYGAFSSSFAGAVHSIPWQVGTLAAMPGTCTTGEAYFATNALAGQQIYECSATNTWTQEINSGGISSLNGLSGAVQTFGNDTNVTVVSSGTVHTITWAGLLGLARGGCNANLVSTGGAHQVLRQSSSGAACTVSQLASADLSDVANLVNTGANFTYGAFTANFSGAAHTLPWQVGTVLPATCTVGEGFFASNAVAGQMIYQCSALNTWTQEGVGLESLNGLSGASQTFANDTNVTIVSAGTVHTITWAGLLGLARGGCNANLVSTGGAHQVLRQSSSGAACTVSQLASADLSDVANLVNTGANFTYGAFTSSFAAAAHSIPWHVGTIAALPATCTTGEAYFATNATLGQQIYECASTNSWIQQLNSGGISSLNGLSGAVQTFGNDTNVTVVSSGTVHTITWAGLLGLARGGCNANLVSTGGAHQVLRQSSSGAACTVSQLASADLSDVANLMSTAGGFAYGPYTSNFSGAAHSIPWQVGLLAARPSACTVGEAYFASDATAGQAIYECNVANTWTQQLSGGAGNLVIEVNGSNVGTRPALNLISSTGMLQACADNPGLNRVDCTPSLNTASIASLAALQQGDLLTAFSTTGNTAYVGSPAGGCSTTILKSGMVAWFNVDTAGGVASMNYCNKGSANIKRSDGLTDPLLGEIPVHKTFPAFYDGAVWRLPQWMDLLVGLGMPLPVSLTAQTGAITNGTTLCASTNCSAAGQYRVTVYFDSTLVCSVPGSAAIGLNLTWTDETGTKTNQVIPLLANGATSYATTLALGTTTGWASGSVSFWSTGANAIQYGIPYTACSTGTGTYAARIVVERMQ